jgi:hypothetical protein
MSLLNGLVRLVIMAKKSRRNFTNVPERITKENANMVLVSELPEQLTLLQYASCCFLSKDSHIAVRQLIELGAIIRDEFLTGCNHDKSFHVLLQYGANPNVRNSWGSYLWDMGRGWRTKLLFEYGAKVPRDGFHCEEERTRYNTLRDLYVTSRVNYCRRALLTLIWLAPKGLKSLFISWAKWIWSLKPYTNDLQPSIGPTSPIWDKELIEF